MENNQSKDTQMSQSGSRRDFMKSTAQKAAWVAPTLTLMMAASTTPARAQVSYGPHQCVDEFDYYRLWRRVHR